MTHDEPKPEQEKASSTFESPGRATHSQTVGRSRRGKKVSVVLVVILAVVGGLLGIDYFKRAAVREARVKIAEKDYGFALTVLNKYLAKNPNDLVAMSLKGRAHAGLNEFEKCKEIYEKIEGVSDVNDMFAFAKSLTVLEYYAEGYSNWIGVMTNIAQGELDHLDPVDKHALEAEALYFMAVCQTSLGEVDRAAQTAKALIGVAGHQAIGHYLLGLVEIKRGNEKIAIEQWEKVSQLDPTSEKIKIPPYLFWYEIGTLKVEQGLPEQGIQHLEKSLEYNTFIDLQRASNSMEAIGSAYEELGNQEKSEFYWEKQIQFQVQYKLEPSLIAREGLANFSLVNKDPVKAINFLLPLRESRRSSTTYLMQRALAMQGKEKEAREFQLLTKELREKETRIKTIREALREKPGTYWSVVIRAYDFAKEKNWRQAEQLLLSVKENLNDDFSKRVWKAVTEKGVLPSLADVPVNVF